MDKKTQLFVLATGMLCMPMAWADCNRPSTTYEQQDCNFKSERDFRRGNSEVDQEAQRYLESLQRNQEAEQRRQAEQNRLDRVAQEREENLRRARVFTQNLDRMEASATALMNARQSDECISVADQMAEVAVSDRRAEALRISGYCHLQNHGNETKGDARYRNQEFALGESKLKAALRAIESQYGSQNPRTHGFVLTLWAVYTINQREDEAKAIKQRYGLWTTSDEEALTAKRQAALKNPTPATAPTPPAAAVQNLKTDREASKDPQYATQPSMPSEQENLSRAKQLGNQGLALYAAGKYQEAIAVFREALKLRQVIANNPSRDKEPLEINFFNLGMSLLSAREYAEAESMLNQALALRDNEPSLKPKFVLFGIAEERLVHNLEALAELHTRQQKHYKAEPYLRRIVELREKTLGAEHLETLASLKSLAENLSAQGSDKEAALHWQRTVALAEKLPAAQNQLPELRERLLTAYNRSGAFSKEAEALEIQIDWKKPWRRRADEAKTAYKARQYEEAINLGQKALDFAQKHGGAGESLVGTSQNNLAVYYRAAQKYVQAEALYKQALETYARVGGPESPSLIIPLRELSSLYDLQRRFDEAEPLYRQLLALQEKKHGLEHVDVAKTLSKLALLHDRKSQYAEAEPLFSRALAIVDKRGQTDDDEALLLDILPGLARAYRNTGRPDEARQVDQRYAKL